MFQITSQLQKILALMLVVVAQNTPLLAQTPPPPPDNGSPTQREGAASRGPCVRVKNRLTALVPLVESASSFQDATMALGKTADSHPSFWFYVPYTLTSEYPIEFVLQDNAGKKLYATTLKASETKPGIVGFQLPASAPALESGKRYRWFFSVYCNQEVPVIVSGLVERVALNSSLITQLEQATPREKVALYRQADLWHETVTTLAQLRRQSPLSTQLKAEWSDLLESIDLKAIAPEPLTATLTQDSSINTNY